MESIGLGIEHIIGMEIYEQDDMAIDMRSLALGLKSRGGRPPLPEGE